MSCGIALCSGAAEAAATQFQRREGQALRAGSFDGAALSPQGALVSRGAARVIDRPSIPLLWDLVVMGDVTYGGGSEGTGVWRFASEGPAEPIPLPHQETDVFALLPERGGGLIVAAGPSGAIYRLDPKTRRYEELFRPDAAYVWDLAWAPDGALLVATGIPGRVFKLQPKAGATAQAIYAPSEPHVRSLLVTRDRRIVAGTSGSGWVVELDGRGQGFILADADRPEVTALAEDAHGALWIALAGAPSTPVPAGKGRGEAPAANEVVTVTADPGADGKDEKSERTDRPAARAAELPAGGGAVLRLAAGGEPETISSDDKETPLALAPWSEGMLVGVAGSPARIWWLDAQGQRGWFEVREDARAITALAARADGPVAAFANPCAVIAYDGSRPAPARWTSEVLDAKTRASWGRVRVQQSSPAKSAAIRVLVRSGNTAEPGDGWSEWIEAPGAAGPAGDDGAAAPGLPRARYAQVRLEWAAASTIDSLAVSYRGTNRAPRFENVELQPPGVALRPIPPSALAAGDAPIVPIPRGLDAEKALGESPPTWRSKKVYEADALTIGWQVSDPDGDALRYTVQYCRSADGCGAWNTLARGIETTFFAFDARWLSDGLYRFRVIASDAASNTPGEALEGRAVSDELAIDHHPPAIATPRIVRQQDGQLELTFDVNDPGGRLVRAEVSRSPGEWSSIAPTDGVDDGAQENYRAVLAAPEAGDELQVRAVDAAGNVVTRAVELP